MYQKPDPCIIVSGACGLLISCKTCQEGLISPLPLSVDRLQELSQQFADSHQCPVSLSLWLTGQGGSLVLARDQEEASYLLEEKNKAGPGLWRLAPEVTLFLILGEQLAGLEGHWIEWRGYPDGPITYQLEVNTGALLAWLPHVPHFILSGVYHA
jgi:hypothetical protein